MEVVGGIAREVRRETELQPVKGGEPIRVEKVVFRIREETVELHMLPLPEVRDGDEIVVVGTRSSLISHRLLVGLAYDNRTQKANGRHPTWPFIRRTLECFGVILLGALLIFLLPEEGPANLPKLASGLAIPVAAVVWLYALAYEWQSREALDMALTEDIAAKVEEEKRQLAEEQAAEKKRQDEIERRRRLHPIERLIEDSQKNNADFGLDKCRDQLRSLAVAGDPALLAALVARLQSPKVGERVLAAVALEQIRNPAAIPALVAEYDGPAPDGYSIWTYVDGERSDDKEWVPGTDLLGRERRIRCAAAVRCGLPFQEVASEFDPDEIHKLAGEGLLDSATAAAAYVTCIAYKRETTRAIVRLVAIAPDWFETPAAREVSPHAMFPSGILHDGQTTVRLANILARFGDRRALGPLFDHMRGHFDSSDAHKAIWAATQAIQARHPEESQKEAPPAQSMPTAGYLVLDKVKTNDDFRVALSAACRRGTGLVDLDDFRRWLKSPKDSPLPDVLNVEGFNDFAAKFPEKAQHLRELLDAFAALPDRRLRE